MKNICNKLNYDKKNFSQLAKIKYILYKFFHE